MEDLTQLSAIDLFNCIEPIGKLEWDEQTKAVILNLLVQKLNVRFDKFKTFELIEIGNLVTALHASEDSNFNNNASSPSSAIDISQMDLKVPESLDMISILGSKITDPQVVRY